MITSKLASWDFLTNLLTSSPAQAQVSISPMVVDLQATYGQAQASINVSNYSDKSFRARVYTQPFTYDRVTGFKTLTSSPNDLSPYLQFSAKELVIPPGVTKQIKLITRFPANCLEGEYRAVVFIEKLETTKDSDGNQVNIATRTGTTVYIRKGNLAPNLIIDSANYNQQQQIKLLVKNTGKATTRAKVKWSLLQDEQVIKQGNSSPHEIIAENDFYIPLNDTAKIESVLVTGEYQVTGEIIWGENNQNQHKFNVNLTIPTIAKSGK